jgi:hypothetical protein
MLISCGTSSVCDAPVVAHPDRSRRERIIKIKEYAQ